MSNKKPLNVEEPGSAPAETTPAETEVQTSAPQVPEGQETELELDPMLAILLPPEERLPIIDNSPQGTPDQSEIDPSKIKTMTLSKQGWVIPTALADQAKG